MTKPRNFGRERLVAWTIALALIAATPLVAPAADEKKKAEPGFEQGKFQSLTKHTRKVLKLTWKGRALRLDRKHWEKEFEGKSRKEVLKILQKEIPDDGPWAQGQAQRMLNSPSAMLAFMRLKKAAGDEDHFFMGPGMRFQLGDSQNDTFASNAFQGSIDISGKSFRLSLAERKGPARKISFHVDGWGVLRLSVCNSSGSLLLMINQADKGRFSIAHVAGETIFAAGAESFDAFYAKHRDYVDGKLFPLLKHLGVGVPRGKYDPQIVRAVVSELAGHMSEKETQQVRRLITDLNS